ncbi:Uu.00g008320.m01.CDS01 [Anthostomella pinea]|uniref:Uu.00g008320.m01.CDS01 n=1 Tax=Anthostomella pinea TaxID=933095 RepID=A0AAI8VX70_9PEZI|nr:Uu.00g008320.m01.CDS01 [Anthostomella pinea]
MKPPHLQPLALAATLCLTPTSAHSLLSRTGNITLFADAAAPVYVNTFILGRDVCGKENGATP